MQDVMIRAAVAVAGLAMLGTPLRADMPIPEGFRSERTEAAEVNLRFVRDGGPGETVILMHGWPQTWASWVEVMPLLAAAHDVIAVDLRGVGGSDKPMRGYDKKTMAADILALMDELGIERANIVGHDIGAMVAFAFASQWPERAATVTLIDAPIPGTPIFAAIRADPRAWHFGFHAAAEVPEALTTGREDFYYGHFMREMDAGAGGIGEAEIAVTVEAYSVPETASAGFGWYRAMEQDAADNSVFMETMLEVPVLGLNSGRLSASAYLVESMKPVATTVEGRAMDSGHWIPETAPQELSDTLTEFFARR